jgi:serine/threonine-protein kinase HipA
LLLNISDKDNSLNLDLALDVAEYFRIENDKSKKILKQIKKAIASWKNPAVKYKATSAEQYLMAQAFLM